MYEPLSIARAASRSKGGPRLQEDRGLGSFSLFRRDDTREGRGEKRVSIIAIITGIAMVLSLFVLALPAVDVLVTDAAIRWAFFLIVCILLALLLLRVTYPRKRSHFDLPEAAPYGEQVGPVGRMASIIEKGMDGDPVSQMTAYLELKKTAIGRVSVLRRMPRNEIEALLRDEDKLADVVRDDDIVELITADFNRTFLTKHLPADSKGTSSFSVRLKSLIDKLEDMQ